MASTTRLRWRRPDIGIAMGGAGTDTAMEAADVVIMNDDLRRIPELIRLSAPDPRSTVAKHLAGAGHQGRVSCAGGVWTRLDVDGCVRRHGGQFARSWPMACACCGLARALESIKEHCWTDLTGLLNRFSTGHFRIT